MEIENSLSSIYRCYYVQEVNSTAKKEFLHHIPLNLLMEYSGVLEKECS